MRLDCKSVGESRHGFESCHAVQEFVWNAPIRRYSVSAPDTRFTQGMTLSYSELSQWIDEMMRSQAVSEPIQFA